MMLKPSAGLSWCALLLCLMAQGVFASEARVSTLEHFIDGIMVQAITSGETVGATVALVQDGRLLVSRGYGYADFARSEPVQSRVTQFQIGSITKVWVWMAVLQLVEAGTLDLDVDINTYLEAFQIPNNMGDSITLRHLMTHTAGFEDQVLGLFVTGPRQVGSLADTLANQIPARVTLPGSLTAYSNYGAALAGHIVEQVSGLSWNEYVQRHILQPLAMNTASGAQPVAAALLQTLSKGYSMKNGDPQELGALYIPLAPAGAGTATALDMAKLMVELLNPRSTRVLKNTSKAQLINGAYLHHPLINGVTLGMYQRSRGETTAVGHDGSTMVFNSQMVLWPDANVGLFVATNTLGSDSVGRHLVATVSNHLGFDERSETLSNVDNSSVYAGTYISARRNYSGMSKLLAMLNTVSVANDDVHSSLNIVRPQGTYRYKQLAEHVFQQTSGSGRVAFKISAGMAQELYFSDLPPVAYLRASWLETPLYNLLFAGVWLVFALAVIFVWPVSSMTHRHVIAVPGQKFAGLVTYVAILLALVFFIQLGWRGHRTIGCGVASAGSAGATVVVSGCAHFARYAAVCAGIPSIGVRLLVGFPTLTLCDHVSFADRSGGLVLVLESAAAGVVELALLISEQH